MILTMEGRKIKRNKVLFFALVFLVLIIVGLLIGVIVLNVRDRASKEVGVVEVPEKMVGYDGEITAATRALAFSEEIKAKIKNDDLYSYEDAILDYKKAYKKAEGELKIYIGIEYAKFVYDSSDDLDEAVRILEEIGELSMDNKVAMSAYYGSLYDYYIMMKDEAMAKKYEDLLIEISGEGIEVPKDVFNELMGETEEWIED